MTIVYTGRPFLKHVLRSITPKSCSTLALGGLYLASLGLKRGAAAFGFDDPAGVAALRAQRQRSNRRANIRMQQPVL